LSEIPGSRILGYYVDELCGSEGEEIFRHIFPSSPLSVTVTRFIHCYTTSSVVTAVRNNLITPILKVPKWNNAALWDTKRALYVGRQI
jgi:hypothetical protein